MALIRWEPARELGTIQSEINRLFNSFFDTPTRASGAPLRRYVPAMDLVDSGEAFVLKADLPGLSESDVNIEVRDNVLTVSGERKSEHEDRKAGYYRVERSYGSFRRSLTLPEGVDPAAVDGDVRQGRARGDRPQARAAGSAQGHDHRGWRVHRRAAGDRELRGGFRPRGVGPRGVRRRDPGRRVSTCL